MFEGLFSIATVVTAIIIGAALVFLGLSWRYDLQISDNGVAYRLDRLTGQVTTCYYRTIVEGVEEGSQRIVCSAWKTNSLNMEKKGR